MRCKYLWNAGESLTWPSAHLEGKHDLYWFISLILQPSSIDTSPLHAWRHVFSILVHAMHLGLVFPTSFLLKIFVYYVNSSVFLAVILFLNFPCTGFNIFCFKYKHGRHNFTGRRRSLCLFTKETEDLDYNVVWLPIAGWATRSSRWDGRWF